MTTNAIGMAVAAVILIGLAAAFGEALVFPSQASTRLALAYLIPIGSIAVFVLYLVVLRRWEASRAVYVDVVIPFVTVLLSVWLLDERVTAGLAAGGALIVAGVWFGAVRQAPQT